MPARNVVVVREADFAYAHRLPDDPGPCSNLHGHNAKLTVEVQGRVKANGMLLSFDALKEQINRIVKLFDHMPILQLGDPLIEALANKPLINNAGWEALVADMRASINLNGYFDSRRQAMTPFLAGVTFIVVAEPPTSENLAYLVHRLLAPGLYRVGVTAARIRFQETSRGAASYLGDVRETPDFPQVA